MDTTDDPLPGIESPWSSRRCLTNSRDFETVKGLLNICYGEKNCAANSAETDDAGGLPCRQCATADADDARGFVGAQIQTRQGCRRILVVANCRQPIHATMPTLAGLFSSPWISSESRERKYHGENRNSGVRRSRTLPGISIGICLWLCLQKNLTFLLDMFLNALRSVARRELPPREILGARPVAERAAVNGGPQRSEEDLDGAKRAVQSSGTASRAVDG